MESDEQELRAVNLVGRRPCRSYVPATIGPRTPLGESPSETPFVSCGGTITQNMSSQPAVADDTKFQLLDQSRWVVLPSEREGCSIVTVGTLARGLPVGVGIPPTSDVASAMGLVADGRNGVLFRARDPKKMADALLSLLLRRDDWPIMS